MRLGVLGISVSQDAKKKLYLGIFGISVNNLQLRPIEKLDGLNVGVVPFQLHFKSRQNKARRSFYAFV